MLHPSQFQVNEAWIAFQLNEIPICTEDDGSFNCISLMDAASCFLLGAELVPTMEREPPQSQARRLLQTAWEQKKQYPGTLFVPAGQFQGAMATEATRSGITVVPVQESQLLVFIGEARQGYREHMQTGHAGGA